VTHCLQNCKLAADGCVVRSNPSAVVANSCSHRRRRRDATRQNSFVSSASAVCIGLYGPRVHCPLQTPSLVSSVRQLHWLPIYYRIQFKIALLMYNALAGRCLEYIKDIVAPVASNPGRQQLRSAARSDVIVPRCRTKFGSRAFSIARPEVWNCLPQFVRSADSVRQFRRLLKTHYFQLHFGPN